MKNTCWLAVLAVTLGGCEATPKTIQGRKVVGSNWVQGVKVYHLEPNEDDILALQKTLRESAEAVKEIVFQSTVTPKK